MSGKICIITYVVGEKYQEFIPVYIYSITKSYPDYNIIIFCGEELRKNVKESLSLIKEQSKFTIIEDYLSFNVNSLTVRVSSMSKRWLLYSEDFENYEYIYIGDIDIFINKETPSLLDQHLIHCETIGLDYSNVVRRSHYNRVSGLHFVKREPYFSKMLPVIHKYTKLMENNELKYKYSCEYMLYDMLAEAGLGICPRATGKDFADPSQASFRPDHGVHLAIFRDFYVKKRRILSAAIKSQMKLMKETIDDPIFREIENNIESRMVRRIFRRVHKFKVD